MQHRHRRAFTVRRPWLQSRGHPHRPGRGAQPQRGEGLGPARLPQLRRSRSELGTRNIKVALHRLRRSRARATNLSSICADTIRATARNAGYLDLKHGAGAAQHRQGAAVHGYRRVDGRPRRGSPGAVFRRAAEFKHLEFLYFHNCPYEWVWKHNRRRRAERVHGWRCCAPTAPTTGLLRRRRHHEPLRNPAARRQRGAPQPGSRRGVDAAPHPRLPQVPLDRPRASARVIRQSISIMQQLMGNRMYPLTLKGIEEAMRLLTK